MDNVLTRYERVPQNKFILLYTATTLLYAHLHYLYV